VLPLPFSLSTQISPPFCWTSNLQMLRPKPMPSLLSF
jgi:hypothetical protein